MAVIFEWVDALARVLVEAMLNGLWQGLLIVVLVWCLLRLSPPASATTRHAVWFVSLLAVFLLPVFTGGRAWRKGQTAPSVPAHVVQAAAQPLTTTSLPLIAYQTSLPHFVKPTKTIVQPVQPCCAPSSLKLAATNPPAALSNLPSAPHLNWQGALVRWFTGWLPLWLAAFWLMGSVLMLARLAGSYWALHRLRAGLTEVSDDIKDRVAQLAGVYGIRRQLRVMTSRQASPMPQMPMTIGWRKPLIILPHDLSQTLSRAECDSVVAHELAHIKRHDYATNFIQRAAQCLFFFHPAVWFIGKQLVIERELACDDWAVKLTGEPRRYAGCLTKLVEILSESKPLLAATGILFGKHIITRRVEMILNRNRNATTSVSKPALAYAIVLATLCVGICSALSPVIAVPLAQKPQEKAAKVAPPKSPKVAAAAPAAPNTPNAPNALDAPAIAGDLLELNAPLGRIEINGELIDLPPAAALAEISERALDITRDFQGAGVFGPALAPVAPLAPEAPMSPLAHLAQADEWRNFDVYAASPARQSGEKKAPAIPEDEMLKLLSDIVRRDADANVRAEALSGIYRLHSDAAINTLIQLYDQVSDVKTRGEILARLVRRTDDNSKALAKLVQVVKTEKDETLVSRALSSLGYLKGDEGADQLVSVYDSLSDAKMKQRVIRALGYNKGKKAIEKLMAIAKGDSDPLLRQAALRSLSNLDGDTFNFSTGVAAPRAIGKGDSFNFDGQQLFELDRERLLDMKRDVEIKMRDSQERARDLQERAREEIERKGLRAPRANSPEPPETPEPSVPGKKPVAASPKAAPKPASAGGLVI